MKELKLNKVVTKNNFIVDDEIVETEINIKHDKIIVSTKEDFALAYSSIIKILKNLSGASTKVLYWISMNAQYETNLVSLGKPIREMVCRDIGVADQTVKNSIVELKGAGILIPLGSSVYRIHPKYFWRGGQKKRNETMKYILEVECPGCL